MIIEVLKKYWLYALLFIMIVGIVFYFTTCNPVPTNETVYIHDTTIKTKYEKQIDTVTNWKERIFVKEINADTIRYQTVDTLFIEEAKNKDLILGFEKKGTDLTIWALNRNKELLKEEKFTGVYNNFSAYSANDRIHIETDVWEWSGLNVYGDSYISIGNVFKKDSYKNLNYRFGFETGISFKESIELNGGVEHDFTNEDNQLRIGMKVKLY